VPSPQETYEHILIWLPTPMGDTIMATPALAAIRQHFASARITYYGNAVARAVLNPWPHNDAWLDNAGSGRTAWQFRRQRFTRVLLFKNSFGSAWTCFLARIPRRVGYARDGRQWLLTDRLPVPRRPDGRFEPLPMVKYYQALAEHVGCSTPADLPSLWIAPEDETAVPRRLPELNEGEGPLVILVPGGAFGPSKCWPAERYAETARRLIETFQARILLSVSPDPAEARIAALIAKQCPYPLVNLADRPVSLGQLKALFARADLVITNDTGPRHIAIALRRPVISLFGPNDPAWTETGFSGECKITPQGACVCCQKPVCRRPHDFCMATIAVDRVYRTACQILNKNHA